MAVIKSLLQNGSKACLIHFYFESDGTEGELKNFSLVDSQTTDPVLDGVFIKGSKLTVSQMWYSFSWFDATLSFDDLNPVPCWVLSRYLGSHVDFRHFGGLANRFIPPTTDESTDRQNKILISTKDYAPLGSIGTLILEVRKDVN